MTETKRANKQRNRYGIATLPSRSKNIYGIAIGPGGSELYCHLPYTRYSHGINLQLPGQGFVLTLMLIHNPFKQNYINNLADSSLIYADTSFIRSVHNGLLLSVLGTMTMRVNGISFSGFYSSGYRVNGISLNLLGNLYSKINGLVIGVINHTIETNGLQLGFINKTVNLKGFQIGLWNKNERRSLPLINWNFKDKPEK